ncbi:MAG: hypothetical protein JWP92_1088, partial [Caulobacter sp.]|nr:hypothetical protein [Caulobacter sp.]
FLRLGFDDYVGKPIRPAELLNAIDCALHRPPPEAQAVA